MKSAGKARSNGLYRHIRTSKEIIRNLLNYYHNIFISAVDIFISPFPPIHISFFYLFKKIIMIIFKSFI